LKTETFFERSLKGNTFEWLCSISADIICSLCLSLPFGGGFLKTIPELKPEIPGVRAMGNDSESGIKPVHRYIAVQDLIKMID
jgi:hypothetical protein